MGAAASARLMRRTRMSPVTRARAAEEEERALDGSPLASSRSCPVDPTGGGITRCTASWRSAPELLAGGGAQSLPPLGYWAGERGRRAVSSFFVGEDAPREEEGATATAAAAGAAKEEPPQPEDPALLRALDLRAVARQFYALEAACYLQETGYLSKIAQLPCNSGKTRQASVVPYELSRVRLSSSDSADGTDFINASYVSGYIGPRTYIATQAPLANTCADFWQMVWEHGCTTIVMMCCEAELADECHYWPHAKMPTRVCGSFTVTHVSTSALPAEGTLMRVLKLQKQGHSDYAVIRQYCFREWPAGRVPETTSHLTEFARHLVRANPPPFRHTHYAEPPPPLVIHCDVGAGRTGALCAACECIHGATALLLATASTGYIPKEMQCGMLLRSLNLFELAKSLRRQRPCLIQSLDQYLFCHCVLHDALISHGLVPEAVRQTMSTSRLMFGMPPLQPSGEA
eukprot:TRINITY_DN1154_c0_g1_i3.p1 TRINITY_DN1154_c0_g1~~TRINITY_DN1154_c0_g1_i3.p1  ORF type:complete len:515 (+),score=103.89 TRINITY_DN1154_c0_g1_i3:167-1546(+)